MRLVCYLQFRNLLLVKRVTTLLVVIQQRLPVQKVLDGTLTGFSIAGEITEDDTIYDASLEKNIRIIKDYSLSELSLVDVPANQYANVLSIQKNGDFTGMLAKALIENVYYCNHDDVVQLSSTVKSSCPRCDGGMENIGFVESNDPDKAEMVKGILSQVKKSRRLMLCPKKQLKPR